MLYNDFTEKLLGLQDIIITNIEENEKEIHIYAEMKRKSHNCICCSTATDTIHDYRKQVIKDIPAFGKIVTIILRKRRYRCPHCGKRFFEDNSFLPKYHRMTNRLCAFVIDKLRDERSFASVAKEVELSVSTVIRIFDFVSYPKPKLPNVLSIDEFKGNTNGEKYQCIITDPVNKVVLDILPKRFKPYLTEYFNEYSKEERSNVNVFVSDMWGTYSDISTVWLKNATQTIDKFHWIRQAVWAFEKIRKEEQKTLGADLRKYFKRSKSLLTKSYDSLTEEQRQEVNVMLCYSVNISRAYFYKENFFKAIRTRDPETAKKQLSEWIKSARNCGLEPFEKCADTMQHWFTGIINSFSTNITNGFTEGCNNKIKVLKRNAYGYRNFNRFRNRILHMFHYKALQCKAAA